MSFIRYLKNSPIIFPVVYSFPLVPMAPKTSVNKSFDLEEYTLQTFTRKNVETYTKYLKLFFFLLLFLLVAYTVWFSINETISPSSKIEKILKTAQQGASNTSQNFQDFDGKLNISRKDLRIVRETKLFGGVSTNTSEPEAVVEEPVDPLNLTLIGTIYSSGESSVAILEDKKGREQEVFKIGESVFEQGTLQSITSHSVDIERNGKIETLTIDDAAVEGDGDGSGVSASADAEEIKVDATELDAALENLPLLLTQARAVPYFKQGKSVGLRLFAIKTGSLYEKIGLKNGDILKTINGKSLGDFSQAMKLFEQLKEQRSLNLSLQRNRADKAYYYKIQ